ncbi:hypothetical protein DD902_13720, partial [Staphylococcus pseudintermedius]
MYGGDCRVTKSDALIAKTKHCGVHNYLPLPLVIADAEGVWLKDPAGNRYMDMLAAYLSLIR